MPASTQPAPENPSAAWWVLAAGAVAKAWTKVVQWYAYRDRVAKQLRREMAEMNDRLLREIGDLRAENRRLRETNERQQGEIDKLKASLADEKQLKHAAVQQANVLTLDNANLKLRVAELEQRVGVRPPTIQT